MRRVLYLVVAGAFALGATPALATPVLEEGNLQLGKGVPHERCVALQGTQQAGPVDVHCDWGEDEMGAGLGIDGEAQDKDHRDWDLF